MAEEAHRETAPLRTLLAAAIAGSLPAWSIGFNLGAFRTVFFDEAFMVWVVSTVTLAVALLYRSRVAASWWMLAALATPTAWLLAGFLDDPATQGAGDSVSLWLALVATALSLPVVAYVVLVALNPDLFDLGTMRERAIVAVLVLAVGLVGIAVGRANDRFLTCGDFAISGNALPDNCAPGLPARF